MFVVTMHTWTVNEKRRITGKAPTIVQCKGDTLKQAMAQVIDLKNNHDMRHSTPYDIVDVINTADQ
jgi:hypothetical protein